MCNQHFLKTFKKKSQLRSAPEHEPKNSTNRPANMTLKKNRELTNEITSPKKFNPAVDLKNSTLEHAQAINFKKMNFIFIHKSWFNRFENGEEIDLRVPLLGSQQESDGY